MDPRAPQDARIRTLIVRFFNDPAGRLQARVVDPATDRAWLVAEAESLHALAFAETHAGRDETSGDASPGR
jgi:hypothetical protein